MAKDTDQIIYLGPEEDLTNVSERLAQTPAQRITLVIPSQTQLRSHVSWRVLFSRTRKMGKEVLVISSDRQIRSMVKEAGFRVADSLESPSTHKQGRAGGRFGLGRSGSAGGAKPAQPIRNPPGKVGSSERTGGPRLRQRSQSLDLEAGDNAPARRVPPPTWTPTMGGTQEETLHRSPAATPPDREELFGKSYGFQIDTSPPVQPGTAPIEEEEETEEWPPELDRAMSIREAAIQGSSEILPGGQVTEATPPTEVTSPQMGMQSYDMPVVHELDNEPYPAQQNAQSTSLREQRGSVNMIGRDESVPDISDVPTEVEINIEDLGDQGDIVLDHEAQDIEPRRGRQPILEGEPEPPRASHVLGTRPRNNRQGHALPPDYESEDALPPIAERDTLIIPPPAPSKGSAGRPSAPLSPAAQSGRASQSASAQQRLPTPQRPLQMKSTPQRMPQGHTSPPDRAPSPGERYPQSRSQPLPRPQQRPGDRAVAVIPKSPAAKPSPAKRGSRKGTVVGLIVSIAVLLLVLALGWLLPSAEVTVYVPTQSFGAPLHLTASVTGQQDVIQHTMHANQLVLDTSASGTGSATGSTTVGTVKASGNVIFTNTVKQPLDLPTNTILETGNGVQFMTTADVLIPAAGSQGINPPIPIEAVKAGTDGNVAANSITVIPDDSLSSIEKNNNNISLSPSSLKVTNPDPTTGGGAGKAKSVTQSDVNALKASLEQTLKKQVTVWLKQQVHTGDIQGTPNQVETPTATPAIGQVASNGSFTEVLKLHLVVLVVRATDLQAAASAELNALLAAKKPQYILVPQQSLTFTKMKPTTSKDKTSLILSFTANGQIMSKITQDQVRSILAGKGRSDAANSLKSSTGTIQDVNIQVSPGFFPWVPFWSERIHVTFQPVPTKR